MSDSIRLARIAACCFMAAAQCATGSAAPVGKATAPASDRPGNVWIADLAHSSIEFRTSHWGIVDIIGWFDDFEIAVWDNGEDFTGAAVEAAIRLGSVRMPNMEMAANLHGMFDIEQFPVARFVSTKVEKTGAGAYRMIGELTLKGATREIAWDVRFNGFGAPPHGAPGFTATTTLERLDYGIGDAAVLPGTERPIVGHEILIRCNLRLTQSSARMERGMIAGGSTQEPGGATADEERAQGAAPPHDAGGLEISLERGSKEESATRDQLLRLLEQFDVENLIVTRRIHIESGVIPHSHPVLTLHTAHLSEDERLLSTFLHEQLHWLLTDDPGTGAAMTDLEKLYPGIPVGYPDGARDRSSSYLHLVVCHLEHQAMSRLVGAEASRRTMRGWRHYRWIYATILEDYDRIAVILEEHQLKLPD